MNDRELMQQALEALESDPISHAGLVNRKQAITALRQALETEREWVGLTDDEIIEPWPFENRIAFARWLEAKLKERNT